MKCERCKTVVAEGEQRVLHGQTLCEDCYMDLLSPPKACDPWAVHSAMTFAKKEAAALKLTPGQQKIVEILQNEGPQEPEILCERIQIKKTDFERDVAALRHMEKIRGELRGGKKLIRLW
jgi:late competence protein required for DNA uptake (superfamily II DNA/RNA helicase)